MKKEECEHYAGPPLPSPGVPWSDVCESIRYLGEQAKVLQAQVAAARAKNEDTKKKNSRTSLKGLA